VNSPHDQELPTGLAPYSRSPVFTEKTVPDAFLKDHSTKPGVWGVIHVLSGQLKFTVPSKEADTMIYAGDKATVEPTVSHKVLPVGAVSFQIEFWR
jgi:tellurite resistance-related uncharacterized protein